MCIQWRSTGSQYCLSYFDNLDILIFYPNKQYFAKYAEWERNGGKGAVLLGCWFSCINVGSCVPICKEHHFVIPPVLWARTGQKLASRLSSRRWMRFPRGCQGSLFNTRLVQNLSASCSELQHRDPGRSQNMEMVCESGSEVVPVGKWVLPHGSELLACTTDCLKGYRWFLVFETEREVQLLGQAFKVQH